MVDGAAGNSEQFLLELEECGDQQRRPAGVEVGGPENPAVVIPALLLPDQHPNAPSCKP